MMIAIRISFVTYWNIMLPPRAAPAALLLPLFLWLFVASAWAGDDASVACTQPSSSAKTCEPIRAVITAAAATDITARVFDSQGHFIRCLGGKAMKSGDQWAVNWDIKDAFGQRIDPGDYTLRIECGTTFQLDNTFGQNGALRGLPGPTFSSPRHLAVDQVGDLYVLDGADSIVYKFRADGSLAKDWDGSNVIKGSTKSRQRLFASVAVDDDGRLLLPMGLGTHSVAVYDGKTGKLAYYLGGFFKGDPIQAGGLAYPTLAFAGNGRIYVTCSTYGIVAAFNALNKPNFEGGFWSLGRPVDKKVPWPHVGMAGDFDGQNGLYLSATVRFAPLLMKLIDHGERASLAYRFDTSYTHPATGQVTKMSDISAITSDRKGVLYVLQRGTQQLMKLVDDGKRFELIAQFGSRGTDAGKFEFVAPHAVVINSAGDTLYLAEDGDRISDAEETIGQARVFKYAVKSRTKLEMKLSINP